MRAMILAAGRGERMKELTHKTPKPLLRVGDRYLIEFAIENLKRAGITEIVINISWRARAIKEALGDGKQYGVILVYSEESQRLETGGGITKALPLLGREPFIVLSADIITDFPLKKLPQQPQGLAHLVLVDNPPFHPHGDFGLAGKQVDMLSAPAYTFANIGVYRPELFDSCAVEVFPLSNLLFPAIRKQQITGEYYKGVWYNVGTPEDLQHAQQLNVT
jgi:MurNAc alpha-1-phosphate uridylyltransferase